MSENISYCSHRCAGSCQLDNLTPPETAAGRWNIRWGDVVDLGVKLLVSRAGHVDAIMAVPQRTIGVAV